MDIWQRGRYLDLWTLVHALSGYVTGNALISLGLAFKTSVVIATVLFIGWEILEYIFKNAESFANRLVDVLACFAGFVLAVMLPRAGFDITNNFFLIITACWIILLISGFLAYKERFFEALKLKKR